jgi:hypothetical protein
VNPYFTAMRAAFLDELEKIAASSKLLRHGKSRIGKRPMRVSTLLRKDKEGEIYKHGEGSMGNVVPFSDEDAPGVTGRAAQAPKSPNDVPSREDGRENAGTKIPGTGRSVLAPAASNSPEEHGNY